MDANPKPEVPPLKARCNRMHIHVPGADPTPAEIIPYIQQRLASHLKDPARTCGPWSGDYIEWKLIHDEYHEFITCLTALAASAPALPPVQNPASPSPAETKPGTNRDDPGTPAQPLPNQPSPVGQNREETGKEPGQSREGSDQPSENSQKTQKLHPPQSDPAAFLAHIQKLNLTQLVQTAIENQFLPDPKQCELTEYAQAFLQWAGPPRAVRLDQLHPTIKALILALLEEHSLKKVEDKLMLPPPFGPYIQTSKSSLSRFRISEHAREAKRNHRAVRKQIAGVLNAPGLPANDYTDATEKLLRLRLVETSLHPEPNLDQTKALVDILEKIRAGKLAERKLALAEEKQK